MKKKVFFQQNNALAHTTVAASDKIKVNSDNAKPALLEVATLVELGYELLLHLRKSLVMSFM